MLAAPGPASAPPKSVVVVPLGPPPTHHKRQIAHEDRDLHEIKRRLRGLGFGEEQEQEEEKQNVGGGGGGEAEAGSLDLATMASTGVLPEGHQPQTQEEDEEVAFMDSDESGDEEEGEDQDDRGSTVSSSSGSTSTKSTSNNGISRIGGDDPRAVMLNLLYKRREPRDKVEAKLESLIRSSLRRANPSYGAILPPASPPPPLSLCNVPHWQGFESKQSGGGGGGGGGGAALNDGEMDI